MSKQKSSFWHKPSNILSACVIGLSLGLLGSIYYMGTHVGSEPAYIKADYQLKHGKVINHKNLNSIIYFDEGDAKVNGLRDDDNNYNNPKVKFINNLCSHPTTHGVVSYVQTKQWNPKFNIDTAHYHDKNYVPINDYKHHTQMMALKMSQNPKYYLNKALEQRTKQLKKSETYNAGQ